jgi:hypothetical protein
VTTRGPIPARFGPAALFIIACASLSAVAAPPEPRSRLSPDLLALYQAAMAGRAAAATSASRPELHFDAQGRVLVEVDLACAGALPTPALKDAGLTVSASVNVPPLCAVEGWVAPQSLATLAEVTGVVRVKLPASAVPPRPQPVKHTTAQL